jgi:hypothetical protein
MIKIDAQGAEERIMAAGTWQTIERFSPTVVAEIDPDIPRRTLRRATFAVDLLAYPDEPDLIQYSRATKCSGSTNTVTCSRAEPFW